MLRNFAWMQNIKGKCQNEVNIDRLEHEIYTLRKDSNEKRLRDVAEKINLPCRIRPKFVMGDREKLHHYYFFCFGRQYIIFPGIPYPSVALRTGPC